MKSLLPLLPGRRRGATRRALWALVATSAWCLIAPAHAQTVASDTPDALEAAFLFNFAKFTKWPSVDDLDSSIRFCIERDSIDDSVFAGWGKKRIQDRPVRVNFFDSPHQSNLSTCTVMFLGDSHTSDEIALIAQTARKNATLLVSNGEKFSRSGGHIELFLLNRRLRFRVNLDEMTAAKLSLGASVLNLAEIVETREDNQ